MPESATSGPVSGGSALGRSQPAAPTAPDSRLDAALSERGLARSRTHAARLIADGLVTVDGLPVIKPSARVGATSTVRVAKLDHYVSRAAHKLIAALNAFTVTVAGCRALDVGASTGGFTQVLLERGAESVIALDVGHAQMSPSIRSDRRVRVVEGVNARYLDQAQLAAASASDSETAAIDLVVADLSFISLTMVLPALVATVGPAADFVLLVKPQFEVGKSAIREGIVRQPGLRNDAVNGVLWSAWDLGLKTAGVLSSPILGTNGNHEYLVWLTGTHGSDPSEWASDVLTLTNGM
ncbi:TlyA family RNA methyltransferase [Nostoc sp. HG1]|nr:TlyA family RNA methyltransferase [Nostoc sp. HG1]